MHYSTLSRVTPNFQGLRVATGGRCSATVCGVPPRRGLETRPRDYLKPGGADWPDGDLEIPGDLDAEVPGVVHFVRYFAQRLKEALEQSGKSKYRVAKDAGIHPTTVTNIINGEHWPNLTTIYRLEVALEHRLWHNQDFRRPWGRSATGDSST